MDDQEQFRAHMKAAAASFEGPAGACPGQDELIAHYRRVLDDETRERVECHLMQCPACRETLRDVAEFFDPPRADEERRTDPDVGREWAGLWRRVRSSHVRPAAPRWMLALAACLVVGLAVSATWSLRSAHEQTALAQRLREAQEANRRLQQEQEAERRQLAALRRPQLNTSIHDVFSSDALVRSAGSGAVNRITVVGGAPFTVILNGEGTRNFPEYALEILDNHGRQVWGGEGLRRGAHGNFSVTFPGGFLAPGRYVFRLFGKGAAASERLADYAVTITSP